MERKEIADELKEHRLNNKHVKTVNILTAFQHPSSVTSAKTNQSDFIRKGESGETERSRQRRDKKRNKGKNLAEKRNTFYTFSFKLLKFSFAASFVAILQLCMESYDRVISIN